jgi:hypothetical protein
MAITKKKNSSSSSNRRTKSHHHYSFCHKLLNLERVQDLHNYYKRNSVESKKNTKLRNSFLILIQKCRNEYPNSLLNPPHSLTHPPNHPSIHPCMLGNVEKISQRNNNMHDSLAIWILALFLFFLKEN